MHTSELLKHIYDINLSYLLLAQRLISQDKASAMFRLGINEEMATMLGGLTLPQMVKLAETNQLVCQFRFDNPQTIDYHAADTGISCGRSATDPYRYSSLHPLAQRNQPA